MEEVYLPFPFPFLFHEQAEEEVELQLFVQDLQEDDDIDGHLEQVVQRDHLKEWHLEEEEGLEGQEHY